MEELWKRMLADEQIVKLFNDINAHINFVIDHGELHTMHVLKYVDMICGVIKVDSKTLALSRVAALLHDSGRLQSRHEHAKYGAIYAKEYLQGKLKPEDIETVCYAIAHHDRESFDYNSTNDVAWILLMADKMDYTQDRYIPALIEEKHKDKTSYNIKTISLTKENESSCKIKFELCKEIPNFVEEFPNMEIYKAVLSYFGFNMQTEFVIV